MSDSTATAAFKKPADHDHRMRAARARAQWEIGDSSWADRILGAYMNPDEDLAALDRERNDGS